MADSEIIIPGRNIELKMTLKALIATSKYVVEHMNEMKPGEKFTIECTDKRKLIIYLQ